MSLLKRQDPLIFLILAAVVVAILAPSVAIAVLFFLYGARLSAQEALRGLNNWRLHLLILGCTFVVFPLIGLGLRPLTLFLPQDLYLGILYLTLVPSTVQSSVAFTSIARGNVAGAIVAASVSNLAGVFLTPLLVFALMNSQSGLRIDASVFLDIALQLLIPFLLGQFARRWLGGLAAHRATKIVDRGSITMVVYSAFSAGVVEGVWATTSAPEVVFLILLSVALVALMLWLTKAGARRLGFGRGDALAAQFCGTKKSLASGLPMASVMFGGGGLGLLILPLMIFHQVQLMMCSWLAARYARQDPSA